MNIENFWGNVKFLCKQNNLTQRELAAKMGVNIRLIENQITARKIPSLEEVLTFCDVFNVPISELLKGVSDNPVVLSINENLLSSQDVAISNIISEKEKLNKKLSEIQAILLK